MKSFFSIILMILAIGCETFTAASAVDSGYAGSAGAESVGAAGAGVAIADGGSANTGGASGVMCNQDWIPDWKRSFAGFGTISQGYLSAFNASNVDTFRDNSHIGSFTFTSNACSSRSFINMKVDNAGSSFLVWSCTNGTKVQRWFSIVGLDSYNQLKSYLDQGYTLGGHKAIDDITPDNKGNMFASGYSDEGNGAYTPVVLKISSGGITKYVSPFTAGDVSGAVSSVATDTKFYTARHRIVSGNLCTTLLGIRNDLTFVYSVDKCLTGENVNVLKLQVDTKDSAFLFSTRSAFSGYELDIINTTGSVLSTNQYPNTFVTSGIVGDNVFAIDINNSVSNLRAFDSTGSEMYSKELAFRADSVSPGTNSLFVSGRTTNNSAVVYEFDLDGNVLSEAYPDLGNTSDVVVVSADNDVIYLLSGNTNARMNRCI